MTGDFAVSSIQKEYNHTLYSQIWNKIIFLFPCSSLFQNRLFRSYVITPVSSQMLCLARLFYPYCGQSLFFFYRQTFTLRFFLYIFLLLGNFVYHYGPFLLPHFAQTFSIQLYIQTVYRLVLSSSSLFFSNPRRYSYRGKIYIFCSRRIISRSEIVI